MEQTKAKRYSRITEQEAIFIKQLIKHGWSYRKIYYYFGISTAQITQLVHGRLSILKPKRCPECGKLHTGEICYACYIENLPKNKPAYELPLSGPCVLGLELRPAEQKLYEIVHRLKMKMIDRYLTERERIENEYIGLPAVDFNKTTDDDLLLQQPDA